MSDKAKILIQLDHDDQPSVLDRVVAVDAGVDHLFSYSNVTTHNVEAMVHGAIFTRGPADLKHTAIFIGGSDVARGEAILQKVCDTFFGPMSVSVMLDSNGANTTAAAAVLAAQKHVPLSGAKATVLGGTGPVGQRVARLLAGQGATVKLASRSIERANEAATTVNEAVGQQHVTGVATTDDASTSRAIDGSAIVIAAGAFGVQLLSAKVREASKALKVAIDLNAVAPAGIEGVKVTDKATGSSGHVVYGAIGVGGTKMKIHKAAIRKLFDANDLVLDAEQIFALGETLS